MILNIIIFTIIYFVFTYFAFVVYLFKAYPEVKDWPDYEKRTEKINTLVKQNGCKLGFNPKGKIAFGFAIPFSNRIFISKRLLKKANFEELLYVIHHEIGHIKLNHPNKLTGLFFLFLFVYVLFSILFNQRSVWFPILLALVFGNIGLYVGRIYEDQADEYALKKIGFEKTKKGIMALRRLSKSKFDYGIIQGYFDVHRTHLARLDRLRALSGGN